MTDAINPAVRGGRKAFFDDPDVDKLLAMMMRILNEHWVLSERVKTLEAVLEDLNVVPPGSVEAYEPDDEQAGAWSMESYALIKSVIEAGQNINNKNRTDGQQE